MMKSALGLVCMLTWLPAFPAQPPLHLTIVSHNEEPSARSIDYLANRIAYLQNRELIRQLALVIRAKGAQWSFQSDWNYLQAVAAYDTSAVTGNTNGKSILSWMVEDLGFEVSPHAHESRYNYADVAYLVEQLGLPRNQVVGGFLYSPADNPQGWEKHEDGIFGLKYPAHFWRADLLWGAASPGHRNDDESYGVWHPRDKDNFHENSDSRRLVYVGGGCKSSFNGATLDGVQAYLDAATKGSLPEDGFFTATIMIDQRQLTPNLIGNIGAHLDALRPQVDAGRVVWQTLSQAFAEWSTIHGARPFRIDCADMEALGR